MVDDTMNLIVVAHVLDVRHDDEEVYISCFNSEVERSFPAERLPMHNDLFVFRLNVPTLCSFNLRLFTRERPSLPVSQQQHHQSAPQLSTTPADSSGSDPMDVDSPRAGEDALDERAGPGGGGSGAVGARPACSRVLRVEPTTHTVMTTPGWKTLLVCWNDLMQSWIKSEAGDSAGVDDVLLMMQFPAGEIGRKLTLEVTHQPDDASPPPRQLDNDNTPGGPLRRLHAREFPVGTECFWTSLAVSSSTVDLRCTVYLHDKLYATESFYHPRLRLPASSGSGAGSDDVQDNGGSGGAAAARGIVATCQLDTHRQHIIAPMLHHLKRPTFVLARDLSTS